MRGNTDKSSINQKMTRGVGATRDYEVARVLHHISLFLLFVMILLTVAAVVLVLPIVRKHVRLLQNSNASNEAVLYDSVLRFHIRANSDDEQDQAVKLKVKDAVVAKVQQYCEEAKEQETTGNMEWKKEDAKKVIDAHRGELVRLARQILQKNGFDNEVNAYFTKENFPVKSYGDLTFPAGNYEAFRMDIGEAKGHNWWCMMYPSLCFVDSTYSEVPDDSKKELKDLVGENEFEELLKDSDTKVEIHSKLFDEWKKWFGK